MPPPHTTNKADDERRRYWMKAKSLVGTCFMMLSAVAVLVWAVYTQQYSAAFTWIGAIATVVSLMYQSVARDFRVLVLNPIRIRNMSKKLGIDCRCWNPDCKNIGTIHLAIHGFTRGGRDTCRTPLNAMACDVHRPVALNDGLNEGFFKVRMTCKLISEFKQIDEDERAKTETMHQHVFGGGGDEAASRMHRDE